MVLLLLLKQHMTPGDIGQIYLIQLLKTYQNTLKLKITKNILDFKYKRDYTHRMVVVPQNEWIQKNWEVWSFKKIAIRNDPIMRKKSQPINAVTFGKC